MLLAVKQVLSLDIGGSWIFMQTTVIVAILKVANKDVIKLQYFELIGSSVLMEN